MPKKRPQLPVPIETLRLVTAALPPDEPARPVAGSTRYFVTALGRVLSVKRGRVRFLTPWAQSRKYLQVTVFYDDGTKDKPLVHRLVAEGFIGEAPLDEYGRPHEVHHVDRVRTNNSAGNLAYLPAADHWVDTVQSEGGPAKLTAAAVFAGRCRVAAGEPVKDVAAALAEEFSVRSSTASAALRGRTWGFVYSPGGTYTVAELAANLGVPLDEATDLLALASPGSGKWAA